MLLFFSLFSSLFWLQYRAAISSVHSTPSKSFILNSSSPNATLLSNQSMSPKHNNSSIQSSPNNSHNNSHNNSINNFQNNFTQSPQSNQHLSASPVHISNQIHNKNNNLSSPSHQSQQQQNLPPHAYALQQKQRSFLTFGFSAGGSGPSRRESHVNVNVTPTSHDITSDTPEIRKYKKRFNSEILCAALWGVNLLIGTENGLMLLDRSGQGKVNIIKSTALIQFGWHFIHHNSLKFTGLSTDIKTTFPTNGSFRRSKYPSYNIW